MDYWDLTSEDLSSLASQNYCHNSEGFMYDYPYGYQSGDMLANSSTCIVRPFCQQPPRRHQYPTPYQVVNPPVNVARSIPCGKVINELVDPRKFKSGLYQKTYSKPLDLPLPKFHQTLNKNFNKTPARDNELNPNLCNKSVLCNVHTEKDMHIQRSSSDCAFQQNSSPDLHYPERQPRGYCTDPTWQNFLSSMASAWDYNEDSISHEYEQNQTITRENLLYEGFVDQRDFRRPDYYGNGCPTSQNSKEFRPYQNPLGFSRNQGSRPVALPRPYSGGLLAMEKAREILENVYHQECFGTRQESPIVTRETYSSQFQRHPPKKNSSAQQVYSSNKRKTNYNKTKHKSEKFKNGKINRYQSKKNTAEKTKLLPISEFLKPVGNFRFSTDCEAVSLSKPEFHPDTTSTEKSGDTVTDISSLEKQSSSICLVSSRGSSEYKRSVLLESTSSTVSHNSSGSDCEPLIKINVDNGLTSDNTGSIVSNVKLTPLPKARRPLVLPYKTSEILPVNVVTSKAMNTRNPATVESICPWTGRRKRLNLVGTVRLPESFMKTAYPLMLKSSHEQSTQIREVKVTQISPIATSTPSSGMLESTLVQSLDSVDAKIPSNRARSMPNIQSDIEKQQIPPRPVNLSLEQQVLSSASEESERNLSFSHDLNDTRFQNKSQRPPLPEWLNAHSHEASCQDNKGFNMPVREDYGVQSSSSMLGSQVSTSELTLPVSHNVSMIEKSTSVYKETQNNNITSYQSPLLKNNQYSDVSNENLQTESNKELKLASYRSCPPNEHSANGPSKQITYSLTTPVTRNNAANRQTKEQSSSIQPFVANSGNHQISQFPLPSVTNLNKANSENDQISQFPLPSVTNLNKANSENHQIIQFPLPSVTNLNNVNSENDHISQPPLPCVTNLNKANSENDQISQFPLPLETNLNNVNSENDQIHQFPLPLETNLNKANRKSDQICQSPLPSVTNLNNSSLECLNNVSQLNCPLKPLQKLGNQDNNIPAKTIPENTAVRKSKRLSEKREKREIAKRKSIDIEKTVSPSIDVSQQVDFKSLATKVCKPLEIKLTRIETHPAYKKAIALLKRKTPSCISPFTFVIEQHEDASCLPSSEKKRKTLEINWTTERHTSLEIQKDKTTCTVSCPSDNGEPVFDGMSLQAGMSSNTNLMAEQANTEIQKDLHVSTVSCASHVKLNTRDSREISLVQINVPKAPVELCHTVIRVGAKLFKLRVIPRQKPVCRYCQMFTAQWDQQVSAHIAQSHPHRCSKCFSTFSSKMESRAHAEEHRTEVHHCELCQRDFKHQCHINKHVMGKLHNQFLEIQRNTTNLFLQILRQHMIDADCAVPSMKMLQDSGDRSLTSYTHNLEQGELMHHYYKSNEFVRLMNQFKKYLKRIVLSHNLRSRKQSNIRFRAIENSEFKQMSRRLIQSPRSTSLLPFHGSKYQRSKLMRKTSQAHELKTPRRGRIMSTQGTPSTKEREAFSNRDPNQRIKVHPRKTEKQHVQKDLEVKNKISALCEDGCTKMTKSSIENRDSQKQPVIDTGNPVNRGKNNGVPSRSTLDRSIAQNSELQENTKVVNAMSHLPSGEASTSKTQTPSPSFNLSQEDDLFLTDLLKMSEMDDTSGLNSTDSGSCLHEEEEHLQGNDSLLDLSICSSIDSEVSYKPPKESTPKKYIDEQRTSKETFINVKADQGHFNSSIDSMDSVPAMGRPLIDDQMSGSQKTDASRSGFSPCVSRNDLVKSPQPLCVSSTHQETYNKQLITSGSETWSISRTIYQHQSICVTPRHEAYDYTFSTDKSNGSIPSTDFTGDFMGGLIGYNSVREVAFIDSDDLKNADLSEGEKLLQLL